MKTENVKLKLTARVAAVLMLIGGAIAGFAGLAGAGAADICRSEDGIRTLQRGSAWCDSANGGVALAQGPNAEAYADGHGNIARARDGGIANANGGENNEANAVGAGSDATVTNGWGNKAIARDGGTALSDGGSGNVIRATGYGSIAEQIGGDHNVLTATSGGRIQSLSNGSNNQANATDEGFIDLAGGNNNVAIARNHGGSIGLYGDNNNIRVNGGDAQVCLDWNAAQVGPGNAIDLGCNSGPMYQNNPAT